MRQPAAMPPLSGFSRLVAASLFLTMAAARGDDAKRFLWFGRRSAEEVRRSEPAAPSPVISPIPPGDPEGQENSGGGLIARLWQRRAANVPAPAAIPMQQGLVGEATGFDRKTPASESNPQPKPAPAGPPKPPAKSRSTVKTPSSGPIGETFAWEVPPPSAPARRKVESKTAMDSERPRRLTRLSGPGEGEAHFVALRDGIYEAGLKPRTVLRFLDWYTGDVVRARTAGGVEILLKSWQVRDATFDEAANFIRAEGF